MPTYDEKQLEPIKQLAEQLARAVKDRDTRTIAPQAKDAVAAYSAIAGTLLASAQREAAASIATKAAAGQQSQQAQATQAKPETADDKDSK